MAGRLRLRGLYPQVVGFARHPDKELRIRSARALGHLLVPASARTLCALAADPDWAVQAQAVRSLGCPPGLEHASRPGQGPFLPELARPLQRRLRAGRLRPRRRSPAPGDSPPERGPVRRGHGRDGPGHGHPDGRRVDDRISCASSTPGSEHLILTYFLLINTFYFLFNLLSLAGILRYRRMVTFVRFGEIFRMPIVKPVSVIVPAYNEGNGHRRERPLAPVASAIPSSRSSSSTTARPTPPWPG
ncbi:MAG: HEAT repeat domain-containing protein [Ignavibacteriales bacterium]|nr:HEAT repeat domain-containing protein [Ignavibacteriales bacterium]